MCMSLKIPPTKHIYKDKNASEVREIPEDIKISNKNVFRFLMGARSKQGVSRLFVHCKVNCFDVTYRNVINCFTKPITRSSNENVSAIISTVFFLFGSFLPANWTKHVYTSQI